MRRYTIALLTAAGLLAGAGIALAQSGQPEISFPIAELGGCNSKAECKAYCDDSTHAEACLSFAESRGMMSKDEIKTARKFIGQTGPGGCTGSACRQYCNSKEHFAECRAFAEKNGLIPPRGERPQGPAIDKDKEDAVEKLVEREGGPGGCTSKAACKTYCEDSSHLDECMAFAKKSGLMSDDQIERAQKMMKQEGPGGCKGMQCRDYCEDDTHVEECMAFAKEQGLGIGPDDARERERDPWRGEEERPEGRFEGTPDGGPRGNCGTPEECRAKFEASGKELPPGQNVRAIKNSNDTSNVQRQRPTKEQEQQMRQEFDRQGAEEQNRGREMRPFINGGPGAAIISGFDLLTRLLGL